MAQDGLTGLIISGLEKVKANLEGAGQRAGTGMGSYLNTVVYRQIQNIQIQRWMTEGASEGENWAPIKGEYSTYKKRRYGGGTKYKFIGGRGEGRPWTPEGTWPTYPGNGTKLLIASATLVANVIGPTEGNSPFGLTGTPNAHRKLVTEKSIFVGVDDEQLGKERDRAMGGKGKGTPYARDVDKIRTFSKIGPTSKEIIFRGMLRYITKGATR